MLMLFIDVCSSFCGLGFETWSSDLDLQLYLDFVVFIVVVEESRAMWAYKSTNKLCYCVAWKTL